MLHAAAVQGNVEVLKLLLMAKVPLDAKTNDGQGPQSGSGVWWLDNGVVFLWVGCLLRFELTILATATVILHQSIQSCIVHSGLRFFFPESF